MVRIGRVKDVVVYIFLLAVVCVIAPEIRAQADTTGAVQAGGEDVHFTISDREYRLVSNRSEAADQYSVYVHKDRETGAVQYHVSFLAEEFVFEKGLPGVAIVGALTEGPELFDPEHFYPNPRFCEFLHDVLKRYAATWPGLITEAQSIDEGNVYIVDARTATPAGNVPSGDIIGVAIVQDGVVLDYKGNPDYRVFTDDGLPMLDPWLRNRLLDEVETLME